MYKARVIHYITNYVTMNDVANITIAAGCSPVMAEALDEIDDITPRAHCLVLNTGTVNDERIKVMDRASEIAFNNQIPVVLDAVGASASSYRLEFIKKMILMKRISVLKGNLAEILSLIGITTQESVIDSNCKADDSVPLLIQGFACEKEITIAVTGKNDIVSSGYRLELIAGGSPMLQTFTGSGCMAAALIASKICGGSDLYTASKNAFLLMKKAAYQADEAGYNGPMDFKNMLIDRVYNITRGTD